MLSGLLAAIFLMVPSRAFMHYSDSMRMFCFCLSFKMRKLGFAYVLLVKIYLQEFFLPRCLPNLVYK